MLLLIVVLSVGCSGGSAGEQDGEQTATENAGTGARDRTGGNEKGTSGGGDEQNDSVLSEEDINASSTKAEHTNDAAQADPDRTREKDMQETSKQGERLPVEKQKAVKKARMRKTVRKRKPGLPKMTGRDLFLRRMTIRRGQTVFFFSSPGLRAEQKRTGSAKKPLII